MSARFSKEFNTKHPYNPVVAALCALGGGGVNPLVEWVLEPFDFGASLIKSLFQWKVENGKWKIVFIFHYNACSTLQDKTSHTSTTSPGRGCHEVTGEGKNKNNPNTTQTTSPMERTQLCLHLQATNAGEGNFLVIPDLTRNLSMSLLKESKKSLLPANKILYQVQHDNKKTNTTSKIFNTIFNFQFSIHQTTSKICRGAHD